MNNKNILSQNIKIKRAWDTVEPSDGKRYLVNRLWPRGISKENLHLTENGWLKDIAPSTELRKWYDHVDERYPEFKKRYLIELQGIIQQQDLKILKDNALKGTITLIYSGKNRQQNGAVILRDLLTGETNE